MVLVDEATKDVVVALANSTYRGFRPGFFAEMLSLVASQQPRRSHRSSRAPRVPTSGPCRLWDVVLGPVEYRLNLRQDGRLELGGVPDGRDCTFRPRDDGSYVGESGYFDGERLTPCRRSDGSLTIWTSPRLSSRESPTTGLQISRAASTKRAGTQSRR